MKILVPVAASLVPLGVALAGVKAPADDRGASADDAPRCEISVEKQDGGVALEGRVIADPPISGSYRLRVTKTNGGGSAEIVQSGDFSLTSGSSASLGFVSLSAGSYLAELKVEWKGGSADCKERVRGGSKTFSREI
jgi:hypothetical protein